MVKIVLKAQEEFDKNNIKEAGFSMVRIVQNKNDYYNKNNAKGV